MGGYGILVSLLRDYGLDILWFDQYYHNIIAKWFEYKAGIKADLITAFEFFEYFVEPASGMEKLLAIAPTILLSTEIICHPTPDLDKWWYYGNHHGQHIGFFRLETLEYLTKIYNKHLSTDSHTYHLFSENNIMPIFLKPLINKYINILITMYAKKLLQSKTWSDHIKLSEET